MLDTGFFTLHPFKTVFNPYKQIAPPYKTLLMQGNPNPKP